MEFQKIVSITIRTSHRYLKFPASVCQILFFQLHTDISVPSSKSAGTAGGIIRKILSLGLIRLGNRDCHASKHIHHGIPVCLVSGFCSHGDHSRSISSHSVTHHKIWFSGLGGIQLPYFIHLKSLKVHPLFYDLHRIITASRNNAKQLSDFVSNDSFFRNHLYKWIFLRKIREVFFDPFRYPVCIGFVHFSKKGHSKVLKGSFHALAKSFQRLLCFLFFCLFFLFRFWSSLRFFRLFRFLCSGTVFYFRFSGLVGLDGNRFGISILREFSIRRSSIYHAVSVLLVNTSGKYGQRCNAEHSCKKGSEQYIFIFHTCFPLYKRFRAHLR